VRRFVDEVLPLVDIEWVTPDLHRDALEAVLVAGRRKVSLVDWTSFLVMRRRGISTAFALDSDFAAEGFEVIPAPEGPQSG
jgi:predicted nucleic acid-binding protein